MTLYEQMFEMYEDEQEWIMENSTIDDDEYDEYLDNKLGSDREIQYSLKGSSFFDDNWQYRYMYDLDDVAIIGKVFVVGSGLSFINPTRLDLCIAAENIIHNTGDYSYTFLESYNIDGIKYCTLQFGS